MSFGYAMPQVLFLPQYAEVAGCVEYTSFNVIVLKVHLHNQDTNELERTIWALAVYINDTSLFDYTGTFGLLPVLFHPLSAV
jgi:hypothetical protein